MPQTTPCIFPQQTTKSPWIAAVGEEQSSLAVGCSLALAPISRNGCDPHPAVRCAV